MRCLHGLLGAALGLTAAWVHAGSLESAWRARELLGPGVWGRVLRIENAAPGPRSSYPAEFHGLVFALEGILWLYTEFDGTQSLSLYRDRLAADEADVAPLLRAIEPGLTLADEMAGAGPVPPAVAVAPLLHGCFVECVAAWREMQRASAPPDRARLVFGYPGPHRPGHTVLEFWQGSHRLVFDPDGPRRLQELPERVAADPLAVAKAVFPRRWGPEPREARAFDLRGEPATGAGTAVAMQRRRPGETGPQLR